MIKEVIKRDGSLEPFDPKRIESAVAKAAIAIGIDVKRASKIASRATRLVVKILSKKFIEAPPKVEDIQNVVIEALKKLAYRKIAHEYQAYRRKRERIRKLKLALKIPPEPKLSVNAIEVLKARYLLRNEQGKIVESPAQLFKRVARAIAAVDKRYGSDSRKTEKEFYSMMTKLLFMPNSPTLFNAGAPLKQLSACFVLPIEDSLDSIFTAVKQMALIEQSGGGVGFDFSPLRPRGDIVRSTKGVASGPVSFMRIFNTATEVIKAGGKRRGAMMAVLRVDHPDILEFITAKNKPGELSNFNLSVAVTDSFMRLVRKNKDYPLINPRTGKEAQRLSAVKVWNLIAENAWKTGDPGVLFIDEINRHNPTAALGRINATNPCGEQPLLPYESCNLGSINLSRVISNDGIDWDLLGELTRKAVHFLDNVIDANRFPLREIDIATKRTRKIGLGVMGWAECLIQLGIPYDSNDAVSLGAKVMRFITRTAREMSQYLGRERGSFPAFEQSVWHRKYDAMRNATVTTIAPTGSISIIAGCSSGIEPLFAIAFMRRVLAGARLFEVNPIFERIAKKRGFYSAMLIEKIARTGSVQNIKGIPLNIKRLFRTALDISPRWHVRMQAAFQRYTDNAVSKTINLRNDATIGDVKNAFDLAYRLKCKGITVYRYGSKPQQVLYIGKLPKERHISAAPEYAGGCPGVCPH